MFCVCGQLDLITDLVGTPSLDEMKHACEPARQHILRQRHKPEAMRSLYRLSPNATHEAIHLMSRMLTFDPVRRQLARAHARTH